MHHQGERRENEKGVSRDCEAVGLSCSSAATSSGRRLSNVSSAPRESRNGTDGRKTKARRDARENANVNIQGRGRGTSRDERVAEWGGAKRVSPIGQRQSLGNRRDKASRPQFRMVLRTQFPEAFGSPHPGRDALTLPAVGQLKYSTRSVFVESTTFVRRPLVEVNRVRLICRAKIFFWLQITEKFCRQFSRKAFDLALTRRAIIR